MNVEADSFGLSLTIPDEKMLRLDLLLTFFGDPLAVSMNDGEVKPDRTNRGEDWSMASFDLKKFRGQTVRMSGTYPAGENRQARVTA